MSIMKKISSFWKYGYITWGRADWSQKYKYKIRIYSISLSPARKFGFGFQRNRGCCHDGWSEKGASYIASNSGFDLILEFYKRAYYLSFIKRFNREMVGNV